MEFINQVEIMETSFLKKHKELLKHVKSFRQRVEDEGGDWQNIPIQQSDYLRKFLEDIRKNGLQCAYEKYGPDPPGPLHAESVFARVKDNHISTTFDVIIVGAGMAGLAAAYELKKAGLAVKILEQTDRYGGRVFTYGTESGLADGLYGEAGAMRLPGKIDSSDDKRQHYLTDGYIQQFELPTKIFPNYNPCGKTNIYGFSAKTSAWKEQYFHIVWPKWKDGMSEENKKQINDIDEYYNQTTAVVTKQLRTWLHKIENDDINEEITRWDKWIDIWSQFTLESFLESNIDVIKAKVTGEDQKDLDLDALENLLPWSNDALRGYSVFSYTEQLDQSLVQYLRDQLGQWWSHDMHCLVNGMHSLPKAFFERLELNNAVEKNETVCTIRYSFKAKEPRGDFVEVECYPRNTNEKGTIYKARAVIVTTPVNILRQITFKPLVDDEESKKALRENLQAIEDIFTGPSTKIFLQTKTRFWENEGIDGGFSKTNLPIGQIHYVKPDPEFEETTKKGLLLIYTWKNEALLFGSMTKEQVKREAMEQVAEIHPEINQDEGKVDVCIVHSWYNQSSYQGAYGLLKTTQFNNIRRLWEPMGNVYFAGETLSFAAGWIEGALESGLKAAYQVYKRYREEQSRLPAKNE